MAKVTRSDAIPGLGDCVVIRADGEIVATVISSDEGIRTWEGLESAPEDITTQELRERIQGLQRGSASV